MLWMVLVGMLSALGAGWTVAGWQRLTPAQLPDSLHLARNAYALNGSWTPAYPAGGYSRDRLLDERGHPIWVEFRELLGLLDLSSAALEAQESLRWEDAWISSDEEDPIHGGDMSYRQTGNLRIRIDGDTAYVFVESRYWGLLNGVPYSNEPFEELWCLDRNLITYREGRAETILRRNACYSTYPDYTESQWAARKTLMKPDWTIVEQKMKDEYRESFFTLEYNEAGALIKIEEISDLERKNHRLFNRIYVE